MRADAGDAKRIREAIGYGPVLVSGHSDGKHWGGYTFRTAEDMDELVERLLPLLEQVRKEARCDTCHTPNS